MVSVFESVLVANRGESAARVIRTVRAMGLRTVAVYSEADAGLPFVAEADEAVLLGPPRSYLDVPAVLEAAQRSGAQAVHPGYGFLAGNADFAEQAGAAGLVWIGPPPKAIARLADRATARTLLEAAGVPVAAGAGEPAPERVRRVEVQILGLADGSLVALGDRDCSVRRRRQVVAAQTPSPGLAPELRERMLAAAVRAGEVIGYRGAGTVGFLVDVAEQDFAFLELDARLQEAHPVTEMVTGIDLVEQQLLIAAGRPVSFGPMEPSGHAIELRVRAAEPERSLPGTIEVWEEPAGPGIRVDAGYAEGSTVTPHYDPLLATLCVHGQDRPAALDLARAAVAAFRIEGLPTDLPFLTELLGHPGFASGAYGTGLVERMASGGRPDRRVE